MHSRHAALREQAKAVTSGLGVRCKWRIPRQCPLNPLPLTPVTFLQHTSRRAHAHAHAHLHNNNKAITIHVKLCNLNYFLIPFLVFDW